MSIKKNIQTDTWTVSYHKRHKNLKAPISLRRYGIKSRAEAQRTYNDLVIKVNEKIKMKLVPSWDKFLDNFYSFMKKEGLSLKTIESYSTCLNKYTLTKWRDRTLDSITTDEIRDLIFTDTADKSQSHQKNILKFIRAVFAQALDKGYINRNPTPKMKFKTNLKIQAVLTQNEVSVFLDKAKSSGIEWYPTWATALYTGMRSGELYALTWDKVDFEKRQILVNCAWNNKDGFKDTKSGDDRMIEIAPNLMIVLKELYLETKSINFVLPRLRSWDKGEQARELRMFLMGIGLPTIRFHDLRATWATVMLNNGIEPIKVMRMGGWKDLKTMQLYIRKAGVDIKGITDNLDLHNPKVYENKVLPFKNLV